MDSAPGMHLTYRQLKNGVVCRLVSERRSTPFQVVLTGLAYLLRQLDTTKQAIQHRWPQMIRFSIRLDAGNEVCVTFLDNEDLQFAEMGSRPCGRGLALSRTLGPVFCSKIGSVDILGQPVPKPRHANKYIR